MEAITKSWRSPGSKHSRRRNQKLNACATRRCRAPILYAIVLQGESGRALRYFVSAIYTATKSHVGLLRKHGNRSDRTRRVGAEAEGADLSARRSIELHCAALACHGRI